MIADDSAIVARDMGLRRGGRWLLRPADFEFTAGVLGFIGPLGSGKSTLLATFATMRRPQTGALRILGHDVTKASGLRPVRARIGYLPARFRAVRGITVHEFLCYAAYYKGVPMSAVHTVLQTLDMTEIAAHELLRLPPEPRLRAGLAATCVHRPDLVLLDEPLDGIDGCTARDLVPLIRSLAPTVVITARTATAPAGMCDRVTVLSRGRLIETPSPHGEPACA